MFVAGELSDVWIVHHDQVGCIPVDGPLQVSITDFGGQVCGVILCHACDCGFQIVSPVSSCCVLQEVYQQTHPVLYHDRAIYVIVYSLRAEVNLGDLHRHLMNVTIRCKEAPIILVGTHLDAVGGSASLPLADLKAKYPQVRSQWTWGAPSRTFGSPYSLFFRDHAQPWVRDLPGS